MKKLMLFASAIIFVLISSCKKIEEPAPNNQNNTTSTPTGISAKVNGTAFSTAQYGISTFSYGSGIYKVFGISATTDISDPNKPRIQFSFNVQHLITDTIEIDNSYTNVMATYSENGSSYTGLTGKIIITKIDTSSEGLIKNMNATFNFTTDSIAGKNYTVTEGKVNVVK